MADPAESGARGAGDPSDEAARPNPEAIEAKLALVGDDDAWNPASVRAAKRDMLALCAEVRRLRSLAGLMP